MTKADVSRASGSVGDDALALRIVELLNDDAVIGKLKKALYPQALSDKIDSQNAQIDRLLAQLTDSKTRLDQHESASWRIRPITLNNILGVPPWRFNIQVLPKCP